MPPSEIQQLAVAIARMEEMLKNHLEQQAITNTKMTAQAERHARYIYGDGGSNVGAHLRMDRLEQAEKRRKVITTAALLAAVSLWVKHAWHAIAGLGPPPHP